MENKEEIQQSSNNAANNVGNTLGWLEKILALEAKYGIKSIVNGLLILFVAIMMGVIAFNPSVLLLQVEKFQSDRHKELVEQRKKVDPIIKSDLIDLRADLDCDRAVLFETHNGGSNLTGLPFLYLDMTYDEPKSGLAKIMDEYKNISQTRYELIPIVYDSGYWYGSIEDIKEIDNELYYHLQKYNVTYAAFAMLYGDDMPSGILGVIFSCEEMPDEHMVQRTLYKSGAQLTPLLLTDEITNKK